MSPSLDSQFRATTPDDLRLVISQTITADPNLLKDYLSQIVVTLSVGAHEDSSARSLFDPETRVFTLLADRVAVGQEAQVFADEITSWFGAEVAGDLVGDELVAKAPSLIGRLAAMNCSASIRDGVLTLQDGTAFSLVNVVGALDAVANAPANSNSEPEAMGEALDDCVSAAQGALDDLRAAVDQELNAPVDQMDRNGMGVGDLRLAVADLQRERELLQKTLRDVADGLKIIEAHFSKAQKATPADAPFPLVGDAALGYIQGNSSAYLHALEMCNSQTLIAFVEGGFVPAVPVGAAAKLKGRSGIEVVLTEWPDKSSGSGTCYVAEILSGYRKGEPIVMGTTDVPQKFSDPAEALDWLKETGYTVVSPLYAFNVKALDLLRDAVRYVDKPFVSDTAKKEVLGLVDQPPADSREQAVKLLFGVQAAWPFVHSAQGENVDQSQKSLQEKMSTMLRAGIPSAVHAADFQSREVTKPDALGASPSM